MNIFLGSIYPQQVFEELKKRNQFVDYPANVFQHSLLKGLDENFKDLKVISSPVIKSSYAAVKDICVKSFFSHKGNSDNNDVYVGTLPLPGLQILFEFVKVYRTLRKLLKSTNSTNNVVIYALHSPFLLATVLLKKHVSCSCVVVPDLPEYMSQGNALKKCAKRIDRRLINFCLKRLDSYVLLSPYMRDKLPIKDKPWALMEGIYDVSLTPAQVDKSKDRVILYAGSLSKQYGIIELLEAFEGIDKENYRLWICGTGDGKDDVIRMTEKDSRVTYYGVLNHNEVLALQKKATALINPRSSNAEYTKYSFPSKTMEYLASGTPTIMCHLPAIPQEYDQYLFYITEEDAEGIKEKILEVCEKPQQELDEYGHKAAEFIKTQKNAYVQAQNVKDVMGRVNKTERDPCVDNLGK